MSPNVFAYESKVYYLIIEDEQRGDQVILFPIKGNEMVLDALTNVDVRVLRTKKL